MVPSFLYMGRASVRRTRGLKVDGASPVAEMDLGQAVQACQAWSIQHPIPSGIHPSG